MVELQQMFDSHVWFGWHSSASGPPDSLYSILRGCIAGTRCSTKRNVKLLASKPPSTEWNITGIYGLNILQGEERLAKGRAMQRAAGGRTCVFTPMCCEGGEKMMICEMQNAPSPSFSFLSTSGEVAVHCLETGHPSDCHQTPSVSPSSSSLESLLHVHVNRTPKMYVNFQPVLWEFHNFSFCIVWI